MLGSYPCHHSLAHPEHLTGCSQPLWVGWAPLTLARRQAAHLFQDAKLALPEPVLP